jgi:hypothetical protein
MPSFVADRPVSAVVGLPVRVARRAGWAAAELGTHPRRGWAAVRGVRASAPASTRDGLAGIVQWLAVQRIVARAQRLYGVHLLEEGPLQTLWTLGLRSGWDGSTGSLPGLASATPPHLLVVVEAPIDLLSTRLGVRRSGHSRTQALAEPARWAELRRGHDLLHRLVDSAEHDHVVVVNDGVTSRSELARGIAEWVLRAA